MALSSVSVVRVMLPSNILFFYLNKREDDEESKLLVHLLLQVVTIALIFTHIIEHTHGYLVSNMGRSQRHY